MSKCLFCGHQLHEHCECEELNYESAFGAFYYGVQLDFFSLDLIINFVEKMKSEANKPHDNVKNQLLHTHTENCHLCGYYYTDCMCKDFQPDSLLGTLYHLVKTNQIPHKLIHEFVDKVMLNIEAS